MGSATIEKINRFRVASASDGSVIIAMDGQEDTRIVIDCTKDLAQALTMDLIAAGYGPTQRGGRA